VSIYALRKLTRYLKGNPRRASQTSLILHPDVANYLLKEDKVSLLSLERRFRTKINLQPNTQLHLEEIKIA
jgi:Ribonuclease G/E